MRRGASEGVAPVRNAILRLEQVVHLTELRHPKMAERLRGRTEEYKPAAPRHPRDLVASSEVLRDVRGHDDGRAALRQIPEECHHPTFQGGVEPGRWLVE